MPIEFACTQCGATLRADESAAGRATRCPRCQAPAQVPALSAGAGRENPYQSPLAIDAPPTATGGAEGLVAVLRNELGGTRPWVTLVGVFTWVYCGLCIVVGAVAIIAMQFDGVEPGEPFAVFIAYAIAAFVVGAFAWPMSAYARSIRQFEDDASAGTLQAALAAQRNFWRLCGIMTILTIALVALGIIGGIIGVLA